MTTGNRGRNLGEARAVGDAAVRPGPTSAQSIRECVAKLQVRLLPHSPDPSGRPIPEARSANQESIPKSRNIPAVRSTRSWNWR